MMNSNSEDSSNEPNNKESGDFGSSLDNSNSGLRGSDFLLIFKLIKSFYKVYSLR